METIADVQNCLASFDGSGHEQTHTMQMALRQPHDVQVGQTIPLQSSSGTVPNMISSDDSALQMAINLAEQALQKDFGVDSGGHTISIVTKSAQGEMRYMVIATESDKIKSSEDKDTAEDNGEIVSEEVWPDDTKTRAMHITGKESQIMKPTHTCNFCSYTSHRKGLLSRHMKSHSDERPYKCGLCEKGFKHLATLGYHLDAHTGTKPHSCKDCGSSFVKSGDLVRHIRYRHTHQKRYKCTECEYASVESGKLKLHMRCHTGERPYQCPHCTYASVDNSGLRRHLRVHTGEKPYECDICQTQFTQANSLKTHKLMHAENRPTFPCELCEKTYNRKTELRKHMQKLHVSDKSLECNRCSEIFPDRYTYKLHLKTHEGEKCFKCYLCSYASVSQHRLYTHMIVHTGQKPFPCDECNQAFRQRKMLELHKNLHHNPNSAPPEEQVNECSECGKHFKHKGFLIRHLAMHNQNASADDSDAEVPKIRRLRIRAPKGFLEQRDDEEEEDEVDLSSTIEVATDEDKEQVAARESIGLHTQETTTAASLSEDGTNMAIGESYENLAALRDMEEKQCCDNAMEVSVAEDKPIPSAPKKRGRPRKCPVGDTPKPVEDLETKEFVTSRYGRKRKASGNKLSPGEEGTNDPQFTPTATFSKKRRILQPHRVNRKDKPKVHRKKVAVSTEHADATGDTVELVRWENELTKRQLEQKEKDLAECFGFNGDDEGTAMSTIPETKNMVQLNDDQ